MLKDEIVEKIKKVVNKRNTTGAEPFGSEYWDIKSNESLYRVVFAGGDDMEILDASEKVVGTFKYYLKKNSGKYKGRIYNIDKAYV